MLRTHRRDSVPVYSGEWSLRSTSSRGLGKNVVVLHAAKWLSASGRQANLRWCAPLQHVRFDPRSQKAGKKIHRDFRRKTKNRVVSGGIGQSVAAEVFCPF